MRAASTQGKVVCSMLCDAARGRQRNTQSRLHSSRVNGQNIISPPFSGIVPRAGGGGKVRQNQDGRVVNMAIPRMRTAEKALELIKAEDPDTEVSMYYIRKIIKAGAVPVATCGRRILVNVDALIELLANGYDLPAEPAPREVGRIRRVV